VPGRTEWACRQYLEARVTRAPGPPPRPRPPIRFVYTQTARARAQPPPPPRWGRAPGSSQWVERPTPSVDAKAVVRTRTEVAASLCLCTAHVHSSQSCAVRGVAPPPPPASRPSSGPVPRPHWPGAKGASFLFLFPLISKYTARQQQKLAACSRSRSRCSREAPHHGPPICVRGRAFALARHTQRGHCNSALGSSSSHHWRLHRAGRLCA
jgi:hypothetical protein